MSDADEILRVTVFVDSAGNELFHLRHKLLAISKSFYGESPDGKDLFEVKGHFSRNAPKPTFPRQNPSNHPATVLSSKSSISFTNAADGKPITLDLKGDWLDRSAEVTLGGRPVASISRDFVNFGQVFSDRQTYYVSCAPGVDLVLMAAVCVCLDERENEQN